MQSALLCQGRLTDFIALGQDGAPIFKNAAAFCDALSRMSEGGKDLSRYLAAPKFNLDYTKVEWYVPFAPQDKSGDYLIVSWTSARPDEREKALKELDALAATLYDRGLDLQSMRTDKNARLFAHYMTGQGSSSRLPAIHCPGSEYIYIVDGHPVITFWGFLKQGQKLGADPFAMLKEGQKDAVIPPPPPQGAGRPAAALAQGEACAVKSRCPLCFLKHRCPLLFNLPLWLWLLLLPLLLLLLYTLWWWLWGRPWGLSWPDIRANLKAPFIEAPDLRGRGTDGYDLNLQGDGVRVNLPDADLTGARVPDASLPAIEEEAPGLELGQEEEALLPPSAEPANPLSEPGADLEQVQEQGAEQEALPEERPVPEPEAGSENVSEEQHAPEPQIQPVPADTEATAAPDELKLDARALQQGDLSALSGQWQTRSGMMDTVTGRPLNLSYSYENGQGKLEVQRQDKSKCTVSASPVITGSELEIVADGKAVCPDNTSYELPRIVCQSGDDGAAKCHASYDDNYQFPIRMYAK